MSEPVIKRERSPTPELSTYALAASALVGSPGSTSSNEDTKPPQMELVRAMEKMKGNQGSDSCLLPACPLTFADFPAQQGLAVATERVNKAANASTVTTPTAPTFGRSEQHFENANMDLNNRSANMSHQGFDEDFQLFPPTASNSPEHIGDSVMVSRRKLMQVETQIDQLMNAAAVTQHQIARHNNVIGELANFNRNSHTQMQQLTARIMQLEAVSKNHSPTVAQNFSSMLFQDPSFATHNQRLSFNNGLAQDHDDMDDRSKSPSPTAHRYRNRGNRSVGASLKTTMSGRVQKSKSRKQLSITIPNNLAMPTMGAGLPTPMTKTAASIPSGTFQPTSAPNTPVTPGRIGPMQPINRSKPLTKRVSRGAHNPDKIMAPVYVLMPLVPLTDTEIIVYFFQSAARPLVSLRLYARNWGPASIVDVLNEHRLIEPEYLRNTCSVKFTTAIKKGRELYGEQWVETHRDIFENADDPEATDLIHLSPDEVQYAKDINIRELCVNLKKHPVEGVTGGIFTRCVKYVQENAEAEYTLKTVCQLASDFQAGRLPVITGSESEEPEKSTRSESPGSDASDAPTPLDSVMGDDSTAETEEST